MLYLSANAIHNMQMGEINSEVSRYWHEWRNKGYQMEEPPRISADW